MKQVIAIIVIVLCFWVVVFSLMEYFSYGGLISNKTEQKYIRNFDKFTINTIGYRDQTYVETGKDSLTFISVTCFHWTDVLSKYYIDNVGLIRRGSALHKKLDSLFNTKHPKNNYQ